MVLGGGKPPSMIGSFPAVARAIVIALGAVIVLAVTAHAQEQSPEAPILLPPVTISAPARLPGSPLPEASVPATVQTITGAEIRQSGAVTLQDYLRRLPGVTLND